MDTNDTPAAAGHDDHEDNDSAATSPAPTPPRTHLTDDLSFALPPGLKDKSMHIFASADDGPSEFNLVISRAEVAADDTLDDFAQRLVAELQRALPKFRLDGSRTLQLDGGPALELRYGWSNQGVAMHQRQTVLLAEDPAGGRPEALLVAGTCRGTFSDAWNEALDGVLASLQRRRPWPFPAPAAAAPPEPAEAPEPPLAFALGSDGTLQVLSWVDEIVATIDAGEVAAGRWKFYDDAGLPLEVHWQTPPRRGLMRREPGTYTLAHAGPTSGLGPLISRLALVDRVHGRLQDVQQVRDHLVQRTRHGHA